MNEEYSEEQYNNDFKKHKKDALKHALDIRKFEIELYWKRATYFWTFIAATLAGYGAIQASSIPNKTDLSIVLACLGIVFSFGWFCVNKGSKYWQENWEKHVDMLEDEVVGPIYKVILCSPKPFGKLKKIQYLITGPASYSVSKINQIISLYVSLLWLFLLFKSLPEFNINSKIEFEYVFIIGLTFLTCICFFYFGRTKKTSKQSKFRSYKRSVDIQWGVTDKPNK